MFSKTSKLVLSIAFMLAVIEGEKEVVAPALPYVKDFFAASYQMTQAIVYLNFLGFCVSCLFAGTLIQRLGYRKTFLSFSVLFVLASLLTCLTFSLPAILL